MFEDAKYHLCLARPLGFRIISCILLWNYVLISYSISNDRLCFYRTGARFQTLDFGFIDLVFDFLRDGLRIHLSYALGHFMVRFHIFPPNGWVR